MRFNVHTCGRIIYNCNHRQATIVKLFENYVVVPFFKLLRKTIMKDTLMEYDFREVISLSEIYKHNIEQGFDDDLLIHLERDILQALMEAIFDKETALKVPLRPVEEPMGDWK